MTYQLCKQVKAAAMRVRTEAARARAAAYSGDAEDSTRRLLRRVRPKSRAEHPPPFLSFLPLPVGSRHTMMEHPGSEGGWHVVAKRGER